VLMETKSVHFCQGLIGRPVIEGDAVGGDEYAGAIFTEFAVNENCLRRGFAEQLEKFGELRGSGRGKSAHGNGVEVNAERLRFQPFAIARLRRFSAQIHDSVDAEFFQFREIVKMRLSAAKKVIGDLSSVRNAGDRDLCGDGRRRSRVERRSLPKRNRASEERKGESAEER